MQKHRYFSIIAVIILLVGIGSSVHVNASKQDSEFITINGEEFSVELLFKSAQQKTIENEQGIALDSVIEYIGTENPQSFVYTLVGADGYQKTVNWENMRNGILTMKRESIFLDLPKAFKVKNIIEIKVE